MREPPGQADGQPSPWLPARGASARRALTTARNPTADRLHDIDSAASTSGAGDAWSTASSPSAGSPTPSPADPCALAVRPRRLSGCRNRPPNGFDLHRGLTAAGDGVARRLGPSTRWHRAGREPGAPGQTGSDGPPPFRPGRNTSRVWLAEPGGATPLPQWRAAEGARRTVDRFAAEYFQRQDLRDSTRVLYRESVAVHLADRWTGVAVGDVTPAMVRTWHARPPRPPGRPCSRRATGCSAPSWASPSPTTPSRPTRASCAGRPPQRRPDRPGP